jgi:hypothetical protein
MSRRSPDEYIRDTRSNSEVHADMLNAIRTARCRSTVTAQTDPYVELGSGLVKTRPVSFRCTLLVGHDGNHLAEVGTLTEPRQIVFPRDGREDVLSPEIRQELGR